jgi:hypothetical protein
MGECRTENELHSSNTFISSQITLIIDIAGLTEKFLILRDRTADKCFMIDFSALTFPRDVG